MNDSDFDLQVNPLSATPALSQVEAQLPAKSFTVVLGASGSGKSLLLALLAGRLDTDALGFDSTITSTDSRNALRDPRPLTSQDMQAMAAYLPPEDIVFGFDTPREALVFRHRLYYGSTAEEAAAAANELLEEFGLTQCADNLIAPGVGLRGISGGQRRRTCIAMALVTRPQVLLLDEPTTGLDSYTAKGVMAALQRIAHVRGCVVVAALQHPGPDLFQHIDRTIELTDRGVCAFCGPVGASSRRPSVMTDVSTVDSVVATPVPAVVNNGVSDPRRASLLQQFGLVAQRNLRGLVRNPASLVMRVAQSVVLSLFFGIIFNNLSLHPDNFKQILGFFVVFVSAVFVPVQTGAAIFPMEKDVFLEEQALPYRYPAAVYAMSKPLVESFFEIPLGVLFALIIGFMLGLPPDVVGRLCVTSVLLFAAGEAFGFVVSTVAPPAVSIAVVIPVTSVTMMLVGTAMASPSGPTQGIFDALKYVSFLRNGFAALALVVLPLVSGTCTSQCYYASGHDAIVALDLDSTSQGREWGLLVMWIVVFRVASAVALTVLGWNRRVPHEDRPRAPLPSEELTSIMMSTNDEESRATIMYTAPRRVSLRWAVRFRVKPRFGEGSDAWRTILQPMEGIAHAGRCLAVMGGSGAGKSTLLEALTLQLPASGWYTVTDRRCLVEAVDDATQQVIGDPLGARARSLMAVVYQDPLFIPGLTVGEVVEFAAAIHGCHAEVVDALLECMDLTHARHVRASSLSVSQKKRLAVCEAVAMRRPIVALDEPTSGLDSKSSRQLLSVLHELAHAHGVTVLYTLHQPGDELLPYIDDLLLLSQGSVMYHGPLSDASVHFQDFVKPAGLNETDHYLELSSAPDTSEFFQTAWREAHPTERMKEDMLCDEEGAWSRPPGEFGDSAAESETLKPFEGLHDDVKGFKALVWRSFNVSVVKVPKWNLGLRFIALFVVMPLVIGISQYQLATNVVMLQNGVFMMCLSLSLTATLAPLLAVSHDLPVLLRDQAVGKYSPQAYYMARTVAGLPLEVLGTTISAAITFSMMGMPHDTESFFVYLTVLLLVGHASGGIGFMLGITIHAPVLSGALATMVQIMSATGAGVLIAPSSIDRSGWLRIMEFVSPSRQGLLIILHDQMRSIANGEVMLERVLEFNRSYDEVLPVWIMLISLLLVFRCGAALCFHVFARPSSY